MGYYRGMQFNQALDLSESPVLATAITDRAAAGSGMAERVETPRGQQTRERLLAEATRIFAAKGFAKTSTREICQAAATNIASIHYHFGDKAGLYRAVLMTPVERMGADLPAFDDPSWPLADALRAFMGPLLSPWNGDEYATWVLRLHLREMVEPTHDYAEEIARMVQPWHQRLLTVLARHVGVPRPDAALHQLAFALGAMVHDYGLSRDCMLRLAPDLLAGPRPMEAVLERLVGYGCALVEHERRHRQPAADPLR